MGNFDECLAVSSRNSSVKGKYCLGYISTKTANTSDSAIVLDFKEHNYLVRIFQIITPGIALAGDPTWAICLPSDCSSDEILSILTNSTSMTFDISSLSCQTKEDIHEPLRAEAIAAM